MTRPDSHQDLPYGDTKPQGMNDDDYEDQLHDAIVEELGIDGQARYRLRVETDSGDVTFILEDVSGREPVTVSGLIAPVEEYNLRENNIGPSAKMIADKLRPDLEAKKAGNPASP